MTDAEIACCRRSFASARSLVEYGSGGTTLLAVEAGLRRIVSVESDRRWIKRLRREAASIRRAERIGRLAFRFVDLGPVAAYGYPAGERARERWPDYPAAPWRTGWVDRLLRRPPPDLVLIDGRFRVACAVETAARAAPGTRVLVHDYRDRPHYAPIGDILDLVELIDTLAVFVVREPLSSPRHAELLAACTGDPR